MLTQEFGHVQDFMCPNLWGLIKTLTLKPSQIGHSSGMDINVQMERYPRNRDTQVFDILDSWSKALKRT